MVSVPVSNRCLLLVPVLVNMIGQIRNYGILLCHLQIVDHWKKGRPEEKGELKVH